MSVPLYLFKGPEFGEKNEALLQLKNQVKKNFQTVEFSSFYAMETDVNQIMMQFSNMSLFSDAKFFVIKNAELIKTKEQISLIENWAKSAKEQNVQDSVLVLITDTNKIDAKLEKIVPKENVKMFWEMFENRKIPWLTEYFRKNGFNLHEDAAQSILNLVENNTESLKNECSRFFVCFPNGHFITPEDIEKVLAHNREETTFTLFDAMCSNNNISKRLENSLEILQKIRQSSSKDSNAIGLISGLLYCFRQLKKYHVLLSSGEMSEVSLKSNGFLTKSSQSQYKRASEIWNYKQTMHILSLISSTDIQLRSMGTSLEDEILQMMIYEIIVKNGNRILEYEID